MVYHSLPWFTMVYYDILPVAFWCYYGDIMCIVESLVCICTLFTIFIDKNKGKARHKRQWLVGAKPFASLS